MKLFQIEEPDGSPTDPDAAGVAIGVDIGGTAAEVAVAVGGNAAMLADRDGFVLDLAVPEPSASADRWRQLFERARLRAERALAQPVTHAVIAAVAPPDPAFTARLIAAGEAAGLTVLRIVVRGERAAAEASALAVAALAEELAPRPDAP